MKKTAGMILLVVMLLAQIASGACADSPPRHDFPPVNGYQVLMGDFHMHTINSDGSLTTRERVEESYRCGYDVIAVTDHYTHRQHRVAAYVGEQLGMVVIRGLETGIAGNEHIVALGVPADYQPANPHNWNEEPGKDTVFYQDQLKKIADSGGIAIYAHPHVGLREPMLWAIENGYLHGLEVKNRVVYDGWSTVLFEGAYCYPFAFDWALENNLAVFANSDMHGTRDHAWPFGTLVFVKDKTSEAVMDAIRAARTAACFEGMVWGPEKLMSDLISASIKVEKTSDGTLTLTNASPLQFRGIDAENGSDIVLEPYASVTAPAAAGAKVLSVQWSNVWVNSKTNLRSSLDL